MTRAQFLNDLYRRLCGNGMDKDQAEQHLTYYAEMLADRMEEGMSEDEAVAGMEDVETIARRILEEEGLPCRSPEETVVPPVYPDASRLEGGGGGTRAYQAPKKRNGRRLAQIALWALAVIVAVSAAGRWMGRRWYGQSHDAPTATAVENAEVGAVDEVMAPLAEDYRDYETAPRDEGYTESGGAYEFTASRIDIQWTSGVVYVQSWGGECVMLQEYGSSPLSERTAMECVEKGGKLEVRYRSGLGLSSMTGDKWLTVLVPEGMLEELEIETSSADVQLLGLQTDRLDVTTTSGYITPMDCYAREAELEAVSGEIFFSGLYAEELDISTTSGGVSGDIRGGGVEVETVSGDIALSAADGDMEYIKLHTTSGAVWLSAEDVSVRSIDVTTTSGEVALGLSYEMGFTLEYDTVSGDLQCIDFDTQLRGGKYVYGGGECEISVETTSGNLEVY